MLDETRETVGTNTEVVVSMPKRGLSEERYRGWEVRGADRVVLGLRARLSLRSASKFWLMWARDGFGALLPSYEVRSDSVFTLNEAAEYSSGTHGDGIRLESSMKGIFSDLACVHSYRFSHGGSGKRWTGTGVPVTRLLAGGQVLNWVCRRVCF